MKNNSQESIKTNTREPGLPIGCPFSKHNWIYCDGGDGNTVEEVKLDPGLASEYCVRFWSLQSGEYRTEFRRITGSQDSVLIDVDFEEPDETSIQWLQDQWADKSGQGSNLIHGLPEWLHNYLSHLLAIAHQPLPPIPPGCPEQSHTWYHIDTEDAPDGSFKIISVSLQSGHRRVEYRNGLLVLKLEYWTPSNDDVATLREYWTRGGEESPAWLEEYLAALVKDAQIKMCMALAEDLR